MNIFIIEPGPRLAARSVCDSHVVKMPVESAQMLSTVQRLLDGKQETRLTATGRQGRYWRLPDEREESLYKAVHIHHPCTVWAGLSRANYIWLCAHGEELCNEYTRRYERIHASAAVIEECYRNSWRIPDGPITPFALAMPDEYKCGDAVESYRRYYLAEKRRIAKWRYSRKPTWWTVAGP